MPNLVSVLDHYDPENRAAKLVVHSYGESSDLEVWIESIPVVANVPANDRAREWMPS